MPDKPNILNALDAQVVTQPAKVESVPAIQAMAVPPAAMTIERLAEAVADMPTPDQKRRGAYVLLPFALHKELKALAKAKGVPLAHLLRHLIIGHHNKNLLELARMNLQTNEVDDLRRQVAAMPDVQALAARNTMLSNELAELRRLLTHYEKLLQTANLMPREPRLQGQGLHEPRRLRRHPDARVTVPAMPGGPHGDHPVRIPRREAPGRVPAARLRPRHARRAGQRQRADGGFPRAATLKWLAGRGVPWPATWCN
jgi:hypothetical protein